MSVFICITLCWNICFHLYYVMLKYLFSHVLRYAEISGFSCIMFCWHFLFLLYYVILKCLISHVVCFAEISGFSCSLLFWNICFHLYYIMLKYVFSWLTFCLNIWFLIYYVKVKSLISPVLRYTWMSDFSCITLCWHFPKSWILFEVFNPFVTPLICTYKKYFTVNSLEKNMCLFHFTISVSVTISPSLGNKMVVL
jgi:hypothetical protein